MSFSIDQLTDYSNKEFFNIFNQATLPEYVKQAQKDDFDLRFTLDKIAFADPVGRYFPINTKARVYISSAYFENKKEALEKHFGKGYTAKVAANIKTAVDIFGIEEDVADVKEALVKQANEDYVIKYAFEKEVNGNKIELLPFKSSSDLTKAANFFAKNIEKYPQEWKEEISCNLVKHAVEMNVDEFPDIVCKYAGLFFSEGTHIREEIKRRAYKLADDQDKKIYAELEKKAFEVESVADIKKIAETCYQVEKEAGLYNSKYTKQVLGDPYDRFFNLDMSKVAEMFDVIDIHGEQFKTVDLQKVSADVYNKAFGIDIDPKDKTALEDVLPTMPRSDMGLFKELSGVRSL